MIIGVPKEIKLQEHRIGLTPDSVKALTEKNHEVLVENNGCLLYTSPSPRDATLSRMPSSA